ncbi:papain family cysteine protease (macronuclear) [Tetrahymena thermophila SB210]|uniref:Papain family cysteine protease n=1 Tax=Tetrahymena thermophila (strain SB210) TaxID=312017 RepID=I7LVU7_TETTS|nr:papain family cysteine protease [Tetrahymena thermophila SB210]EAR99852.2 papain family cysteine protease [Tetrahymena thermophila SB210]|eukprot:XP_001020097.2 papain family cysteine protease [Tetrahymena thermophila SB210]
MSLFSNCLTVKKCNIHPEYNVQFTLLKKTESNQAFYCSLCLLQQNIDSKLLISIDNVVKQVNTEPIFNWPLGISKTITEYLQDKSSVNKKEQLKQKIEDYYKDLEQQFLKQLSESKQQTLQDLENQSALETDIINVYNYYFRRTNLINLLSNNVSNDEEYWNILNQVDEQKEQIFKELEEKIKQIKYIQQQLEKGVPYRIKQNINQLIKNIQFFDSSVKTPEKSEQNNNQLSELNNNFDLTTHDNILYCILHEPINKSLLSKILQEKNKEYQTIKSDIEKLIKEQLPATQSLMLTNLSQLIDQIQEKLVSFECLRYQEFNLLDCKKQDERSKIVKVILQQYLTLNEQQQLAIKQDINSFSKKNVFMEFLDQKKKAEIPQNQFRNQLGGLFQNANQKQQTSLFGGINNLPTTQTEPKVENKTSLFGFSKIVI